MLVPLSIALVFLLLQTVVTGLCPPPGNYTRLDDNHYIKPTLFKTDFEGHMAIVQAEAAALGPHILGRLAFLDNQTKEDIAVQLMQDAIDAGIGNPIPQQATVGLMCFTGDCQSMSNWGWTNDGATMTQPIGSHPSFFDTGNNADGPVCLRLDIRGAQPEWNALADCTMTKNAIFELVIISELDVCASNPCDPGEVCTGCRIDGTHTCQSTATSATPTATTTTTPTTTTPTATTTTMMPTTTTTTITTPTTATSTPTIATPLGTPSTTTTNTPTTTIASVATTATAIPLTKKPVRFYHCSQNTRRNGTVWMAKMEEGGNKGLMCSIACFHRRPQCVAFNVVVNGMMITCQMFSSPMSAGDTLIYSADSSYCG